MKCQFCQQETISWGNRFHSLECVPCRTIYLRAENAAESRICGRLHYIGADYIIQVDLVNQLLKIRHPNILAKNIILTANYPHDTITPQNIKDKLKTYLTFL
jgi:hypothetical protein